MESSLSVQIDKNTTEWLVNSSFKNSSNQALNIERGALSFDSYVTALSPNGDWQATYTVSKEIISANKIKKTIIRWDYGQKKLLQPGETVMLNFTVGNGPLESIDDLNNLIALSEDDPLAKASLLLQAPAKPNAEIEVQPSIRIHRKDEVGAYDKMVTFNWGEEKPIERLFKGRYELTPSSIETEKNFYLPDPSSKTLTLVDGIKSSFNWNYIEKNKATVVVTTPTLNIPAFEYFDPPLLTMKITNSESNSEETVHVRLGQTTERTLMAGTAYKLSFSTVTINNIQYQFKTASGNNVITPNKGENSITVVSEQKTLTPDSSCLVSITIKGITSTAEVPIRIQRREEKQFFYYASSIAAKELSEVKTGSYRVEANVVCEKGKAYKPKASQVLLVEKTENACNASYALNYIEIFDLQLKNTPAYFGFGGITDGSEAIRDAYLTKKIPITGLFLYVGTGGDGDPGVILDDKLVQKQVNTMAADCQAISKNQDDQPVWGALVIYTLQLSGGTEIADVTDPDRLKKHFINTIKYAIAAQKSVTDAPDAPMSFILNPDTIGMLQQQKNQSVIQALYKAGSIQVQKQLAAAFKYLNLTDSIPGFSDEITGYCQSLNWICKHFASDVPHSWQLNLWQTGSSNWVIDKKASNYYTAPEENANEVINFVEKLGVFSGNYPPAFITVDKYERDDFSETARTIGYAYDGEAWERVLWYWGVISDHYKLSVLAWQIPGSHMPLNNETSDMDISTHAGSGGAFFMGDSRLGDDIDSLNSEFLALELATTAPYGATTVGELLQQDKSFDWSRSRIEEAMLVGNVTGVLYGGGQTTAPVSLPTAAGADTIWLPEQLRDYYKKPLDLIKADCTANKTNKKSCK